MPLDRSSILNRPVRRARVVVERGPVATFARAVKATSPEYQDATEAAKAGFDRIPAPPTFAFVAANFGTFPDLQPDDQAPEPLAGVIGELMANGGLILHGEQEFTYERPLQVGDVLATETAIVDTYEKGTMTFVVVETRFTDDATGEPVATSRFNLIHRAPKAASAG